MVSAPGPSWMTSLGVPSLNRSVPAPPRMMHTQPLPATLLFVLLKVLFESLLPSNRSCPVSEALLELVNVVLPPSPISCAHALLLSQAEDCGPTSVSLPPPP